MFGRTFKEAINGTDAIDMIGKDSDDIIWMDVQMPRMNGIKCAEYLRKTLKYNGVIIGLTGHVDQDTINDCEKASNDI